MRMADGEEHEEMRSRVRIRLSPTFRLLRSCAIYTSSSHQRRGARYDRRKIVARVLDQDRIDLHRREIGVVELLMQRGEVEALLALRADRVGHEYQPHQHVLGIGQRLRTMMMARNHLAGMRELPRLRQPRAEH